MYRLALFVALLHQSCPLSGAFRCSIAIYGILLIQRIALLESIKIPELEIVASTDKSNIEFIPWNVVDVFEPILEHQASWSSGLSDLLEYG
jgi:hypothetical protein